MEFEKNKRSKRQSLPLSPISRIQLQAPQLLTQTTPAWRDQETRCQERDERELEERMGEFYMLMGKIKAMEGLWRHGSENKRVEPVLQPAVWQPTFSIEDFDGVDQGEVREREEKGIERERSEEMERPVLKGENKREEKERDQKENQEKSHEEMEWHQVEENNGLDLNLSL